jgi:hypothetical protein
MPARFLIIGNGLKAQKATQKPTALAKAATLAVENPGVEIHLYELHTSVRQDKPTENKEARTSLS